MPGRLKKAARALFGGGLTLEATAACNFRCPNCGTAAGEPLPGELTKEEIFALLEELRPDYVVLTGGEPLLRPDIFEIVDRARTFGRVRLNTNGSLLTPEAAGRLNADEIHLAVDGPPDANAGLRDEKSFAGVERALDALEAAGKLGRARLCVTVSRLNPEGPELVIRRFSPRVRKFAVSRLAPSGRAAAELKLPRLDALRLYLRLLPLRLSNDIAFFAEFGSVFSVPRLETTVRADGRLMTCCLVREPLGDARNPRDLPLLPRFCFLFFSGCADCRRLRR